MVTTAQVGALRRREFLTKASWALLPPETKLRANRRNLVTIQDLGRPSENNCLLNLDMAGINLLEACGFPE